MTQFRGWLVRVWFVRGWFFKGWLVRVWFAFAVLVLATSPMRAEDKPPECQPQPTCEFSKLVIKPGAPTPGIKPQDQAPPGVNLQGKLPIELRETYRLPNMAIEK
jgi:hypothetical protein